MCSWKMEMASDGSTHTGHTQSTCSISGMWRCLLTPYAFMPSAISVYSSACFALLPAALAQSQSYRTVCQHAPSPDAHNDYDNVDGRMCCCVNADPVRLLDGPAANLGANAIRVGLTPSQPRSSSCACSCDVIRNGGAMPP